MATANIYRGIMHGKTIELEREPGLPEGQEVTVTVREGADDEPLASGEGVRRSAGGWGDDPQCLDAYLKWTREQRKLGPRGQL